MLTEPKHWKEFNKFRRCARWTRFRSTAHLNMTYPSRPFASFPFARNHYDQLDDSGQPPKLADKLYFYEYYTATYTSTQNFYSYS